MESSKVSDKGIRPRIHIIADSQALYTQYLQRIAQQKTRIVVRIRSRSKIPFLKHSILHRVIHDIDQIFESYGLVTAGTDMSHNKVRSR